MKRKLVILIAVTAFVLAYCGKEGIINGDNGFELGDLGGGSFDHWDVVTQGAVSFDVPKGDWWASLNHLSLFGGPKTVSKTTDSQAGTYAARLETKKWGDFTIPGILVSGKFDQTQPLGQELVIGQPFNKRPKSFSGYFKYFPQGDDSCGFVVALTKYNLTEGKRDTIAQVNFVSAEAIADYTNISLDFQYTSQENPDSIRVVIIASSEGGLNQGEEGSVLFVDELELKYD